MGKDNPLSEYLALAEKKTGLSRNKLLAIGGTVGAFTIIIIKGTMIIFIIIIIILHLHHHLHHLHHLHPPPPHHHHRRPHPHHPHHHDNDDQWVLHLWSATQLSFSPASLGFSTQLIILSGSTFIYDFFVIFSQARIMSRLSPPQKNKKNYPPSPPVGCQIFTADKTCLWQTKIIKLLVMAEKTLICVHVSGKSKWSLIRALAHKQKEEEHRYLNSNWPNQMDLLFKRQPVLRRIKRPNLVYLWLQCNSITRKASSTSGCSNTCVKNWSILVVNTFRSSGSCADELPPTLVPLLHIPLVIPPPNTHTTSKLIFLIQL